MKLARPPIPPKKRAARAEVRQQADKLRRLALSQTSKQNNFQFLLRKIWRAGVKKLKENCFALLAEVRRAETRSGANQTFSVQKRFEQRSVIATVPVPKLICRHFGQLTFDFYLYYRQKGIKKQGQKEKKLTLPNAKAISAAGEMQQRDRVKRV
ncbi:MAG: hypothetical protein ISS87_01180 [Candidatus Pacebacteria bacterium]|nr:hypothetical protein [Candidatus Paceibacterota bacterium]